MTSVAQAGMEAHAAPHDHDTRDRIRAIVGSSSGNLVEWFDFYAYAFTALYFSYKEK